MHETVLETNGLLQSVFEAANIGISIVNEDGYFVEVNKTFCQLYGYSKNDIIGKHFTFVLPEENQEEALNQHEIFFKNKQRFKANKIILTKDRKTISVKIKSEIIYDSYENAFRVSTFVDNEEKVQNDLIQSVLLEISQAISVTDSPEDLYKLLHFYISNLNFFIYE